MADVFEDLPPERNFLNPMDSGSASADDDEEESDYEGRLYSLVHYSEDSVLKDRDVISNSDTLVYVSKATKVSRLNPVRNIIDTADLLSSVGYKNFGQVHDPNNKFHSNEKDLCSLLNSYRSAASGFSHSTPISKNCHQNTSLVNAFRQKPDSCSFTETQENNFIRIGDQSVTECFNVTDESVFFSDTVLPGCNLTRKTDDIGSKSDKLSPENNLEHSAGSSRIHVTHHARDNENYKGNGKASAKSNPELSRREQGKSQISVIDLDEELSSSKYNMELSRKKTNTPPVRDSDRVASHYDKHTKESKKGDLSDSVIVLDDSDSDSVFEVEAPVKEPPPVVTLISEDEDKPDDKTEAEEEDIVVLYSGGEKPHAETSSENRQLNGDIPVQNKTKEKKKKKKKKERRLGSFSNHGISPSSWTESMSHFYNDSWGGENFDVRELQHRMSGKRSKWPILDCDYEGMNRMNGRRDIKCQKCNHYGHRARFCPEPQKPIVCLYCGIVGHVQTRCPTAICLRCGSRSMVYNFGCHMCSSNRNDNNYPCTVCKLTGHHATNCPELWRRYHSTTNEEDLSSGTQTFYKPCNQQHCSNCTAVGHLYHECHKSRQQGNWQKRANSSFTERNKQVKRRKFDKQTRLFLKARRRALLSVKQPIMSHV